MNKRVAFIFLSAVLVALSAVAELGATKSYWHAIGEGCLAYTLWWLGYETCKNTEGGQHDRT